MMVLCTTAACWQENGNNPVSAWGSEGIAGCREGGSWTGRLSRNRGEETEKGSKSYNKVEYGDGTWQESLEWLTLLVREIRW